MTWDEMDDVIFDGTKKEVNNLKCPDCNTKIYIQYTAKWAALTYGCKKCGRVVKLCKVPEPNYISE